MKFLISFFIAASLVAAPLQNGLNLANTAMVARSVAAGGGGGATSYANAGGTGNRTSIITVTHSGVIVSTASQLVDGNTTGNGRCYYSGALASGAWVQFDFGSSKVIDEAKHYQENAFSHGVWQWQGSPDASSWTNIGATFTLGGVATQTQTTLSGNTTGYRYYRLLGVSGGTSNNPYVYQFEFKISS